MYLDRAIAESELRSLAHGRRRHVLTDVLAQYVLSYLIGDPAAAPESGAHLLMKGSGVPALAGDETKRKERWLRKKYRTPGRCSTTIDDLIERGKL